MTPILECWSNGYAFLITCAFTHTCVPIFFFSLSSPYFCVAWRVHMCLFMMLISFRFRQLTFTLSSLPRVRIFYIFALLPCCYFYHSVTFLLLTEWCASHSHPLSHVDNRLRRRRRRRHWWYKYSLINNAMEEYILTALCNDDLCHMENEHKTRISLTGNAISRLQYTNKHSPIKWKCDK